MDQVNNTGNSTFIFLESNAYLVSSNVLEQHVGIGSSKPETVDASHALVPGSLLGDNGEATVGQGCHTLTRSGVVQVGGDETGTVGYAHLE